MNFLNINLLEARSLMKNRKIREAIELLHGEYGMILHGYQNKYQIR